MIRQEDLQISVIDERPRGGQHVGTMPTVVRVIHIPTGIVARVGTERSQMKNRNIAIAMIEYGLLEAGLAYEKEDGR